MSKDKKKDPVKKTEAKVKVDSHEGNAKKNVGTDSSDVKKDKKDKKDH
jgi:hypothetical protein